MFTGIITDVGEVLALDQAGDLRARIATHFPVAGIDIGASIACDGVCLTVVAVGEHPQANSAVPASRNAPPARRRRNRMSESLIRISRTPLQESIWRT